MGARKRKSSYCVKTFLKFSAVLDLSIQLLRTIFSLSLVDKILSLSLTLVQKAGIKFSLKWKPIDWVAKSQTRLSDFTFTFHFHAMEKEMATHSSVLAWRIPGTGEPGGLPSMGSHRVRHD